MTAIIKDTTLLKGRAFGETYLRENQTQSYVEIPPAAIITASDGSTWTLGTEYVQHGAEYQFNVLRNDVDTGEFASRVVYQRGKVRIFGRGGWRVWTGRSFV